MRTATNNFVTHFEFGDSKNSPIFPRHNIYCYKYWGPKQALKFNRPKADSSYVRIMKILQRGPATRREINQMMGWKITAEGNRFNYRTGHSIPEDQIGTRACNRFCNTIAQMRYAQLVDYDTKTRQWSLGANAAKFIELHKDLF